MPLLKNSLLFILIYFIVFHSSYAINPEKLVNFPESLISYDQNYYALEESYPKQRLPASIKQYPAEFRDEISFWKNIYSIFNEDKVVLHDKKEMGIIYEVLDFTDLKKKSRNRVVYEILKHRSTRKRIKQLKNSFYNCQKNFRSCPKSIKSKIKNQNDFKSLRKNLRTQTGQSNIIKNGISRFKKTSKDVLNLFDQLKAKKEWLVIPFIESSYNHEARSKVNAAGAWQIMPFIAKKLLPFNKFVDGRMSIILAAMTGIRILKQNERSTKSSELAIIAYNSGLRDIFRTRKRLGKKYINYEEYLLKNKSKSFGFASRNFLMEFFALKEVLIDLGLFKINKKSKTLKFYLSKCKIRPKKVLSLLKKFDNKVDVYNNHFRYKKKILGPGQIIITTKSLPRRYYEAVSTRDLKRHPPRKWKLKSKRQSCSII